MPGHNMPFANGVSVSDVQQVAEDAVTANADPLPKDLAHAAPSAEANGISAKGR